MHWESPHTLLLLWLLPAMLGLMALARRRRRAAAERFAREPMLQRLEPPQAGWRVGLKATALLLGVASLVAAAAGPRWGVTFERVQARGVDLFVLLDVSRSMTAEDVKPNRLERAKSDVRDLLTQLRGDRVGLIAFAGAAVVQAPLTTDHGFLTMVLDQIDTDSAPRGGSLIGDAIRKALEAMPPRQDRDQVLVLISDGEDHDSFPEDAARAARERGVKIFAIGLGDAREGNRIPLRDEAGQLTFLRHQGQEIWSRVDERLLESIALATGGGYIPAKTRDYDLGALYQKHLAPLVRGEISSQRRRRYRERFQWFLALGLGCLLLETLVPRYPPSTLPGQTARTS